MRAAIAVISLLLLSACADGRWVANDLSSLSFQFSAPAPSGPFAKSHPTGSQPETAYRPSPSQTATKR
ncbi:hypothetical protein [Pelagibius sp.]|uniref:hypothetical protein n=1 Tax=Pelagibius sp. TaxID=1931238 RepID=UPI0026397570|nr:hypothetical protein [Pelagibius sp.]